jgi:hypothetical protein
MQILVIYVTNTIPHFMRFRIVTGSIHLYCLHMWAVPNAAVIDELCGVFTT